MRERKRMNDERDEFSDWKVQLARLFKTAADLLVIARKKIEQDMERESGMPDERARKTRR